MAHPDEGYLIPDDEWEGFVDPETGENFYPEDNYAPYRLALIRFDRDFRKDITRPGYQERLEKLRAMREAALRGDTTLRDRSVQGVPPPWDEDGNPIPEETEEADD